MKHTNEYICLVGLSLALLNGAGAVSIDHLLGLARPLDQFPLWAIVVLAFIPFGGIIAIELSRRLNGLPQISVEQQ